MRISLFFAFLGSALLGGCAEPVEGELLQIGEVSQIDDGWAFRLEPNSRAANLRDSGISYSVELGDPGNAVNYDAKGCELLVPDHQLFPIGTGVSLSYRGAKSQKRLFIDDRHVMSCERGGLSGCFQVYALVKAQDDSNRNYFNRIDPELIDPLIMEFCDAKAPKTVKLGMRANDR